MDLKYP